MILHQLAGRVTTIDLSTDHPRITIELDIPGHGSVTQMHEGDAVTIHADQGRYR